MTSKVEAETMFTRVAYEKGASVLRMLHAHMLRVSEASSFDTKPWQLRRSRKLLLSEDGRARNLLDASSVDLTGMIS